MVTWPSFTDLTLELSVSDVTCVTIAIPCGVGFISSARYNMTNLRYNITNNTKKGTKKKKEKVQKQYV